MPSLRELRTVFLGSPTFALPSLEALVKAGVHIVGVVTQPDKPAGRGNRVTAPPVKRWAEDHNLPVFQPKGLKKEENRAFLPPLAPDLLVVVAYGKILPKEVLDLPKFGTVNVHASLLPKYRGPAPIPAAILAGDTETGVTIMKLDEGMDTGPTLAMERTPIAPDDTTGTLLKKLADVGARLLIPILERYIQHQFSPATRSLPSREAHGAKWDGEVWPTPQDDARATICPMIAKDDGKIDWSQPAAQIERMVRAYTPWPRAFTHWNGKRLLIHRAHVRTREDTPAVPTGQVMQDADGVAVGAGEGLLVLDEIQLEGGNVLPASAFVRGRRGFVGSTLGD